MKKTKLSKAAPKATLKNTANKQDSKFKLTQQQLKMAEKKAKEITISAGKKLKALQTANKKRISKAEAKVKALKGVLVKLEKGVIDKSKSVQKKLILLKQSLKK